MQISDLLVRQLYEIFCFFSFGDAGFLIFQNCFDPNKKIYIESEFSNNFQ